MITLNQRGHTYEIYNNNNNSYYIVVQCCDHHHRQEAADATNLFSSYVELNPPRKTNVFRYCKRSPLNLISRSWLVVRLIDGMMRRLFIGRLWIVRGAWRAACSQCFWTVAAATRYNNKKYPASGKWEICRSSANKKAPTFTPRYSYAEGRPVRPGL